MTKTMVMLVAVIGATVIAFIMWPDRQPIQAIAAKPKGDAIVSVILPDQMSDEAQMGERAFAATCAACHGLNGAGRDGLGPPLIHKIYEPSHHGDASFERAAQLGVRSHHWPFGDMPPQPGVTAADVTAIISYIRTLQRANGIN